MTEVMSVQFRSQGFPGAPGWTTLCFSPIVVIPDQDKVTAARVFFNSFAPYFPSQWSVAPVGPCQIQDVATGALLGVFPIDVDSAQPIGGGGGPAYGAGAAGACVSWYTASNGIGRPPRGRTFLVPLSSTAYQADGTLSDALMLASPNITDTLITAGVGFGVWRRPKLGAGGQFFTAVQGRMTDQAAVLSSRRS